MPRINRRTDSASRVILSLAKREEPSRSATAEIQQEMLIPRALMSRIVAEPAGRGLLLIFPGRDGGLSLPCSASRITHKDAIEASNDRLCYRSACR